MAFEREPNTIYAQIKGFENLYMISMNGDILNVKTNKMLKLDTVRGYKQITLYKDGERRRYKVHRLVAQTFIPNPNNLPCVNHKDENKSNNNVENLEWCTIKENNNYGTRTIRSKLTQIANIENTKRNKPIVCLENGKVYLSSKEAERETNIDHSHIIKCCKGKQLKAGGYKWKYKSDMCQ